MRQALLAVAAFVALMVVTLADALAPERASVKKCHCHYTCRCGETCNCDRTGWCSTSCECKGK